MREPPVDPFGPMHAGAVATLEMFRAHRRAGGTLVECVCVVAAALVAGNVANDDSQEGADDGQQ